MSIRVADCLIAMSMLDAESVDAGVTDPPYGLRFMGKAWDHGVPGVPYWQAFARLLKPGAWLLSFGGTRTYHRLTCAIEDAGFEIHDCLTWLYGSGFPKHKSKLKPAWEPIVMARKPAPKATMLNIDATRIPSEPFTFSRGATALGRMNDDGWQPKEQSGENHPLGRWPANVCVDEWDEQVLYLRDNLTHDVASLIREYFRDYRRLSGLPEADRHVSEPTQAEKVLQPGMLRGTPRNDSGQAASQVRQDTHAGSSREDERAEARGSEARAGRAYVEGRASHDARLCDGVNVDSLAGRTSGVCVDVVGSQQSNTGAPTRDGAETRSPVACVGDSTSPERQEGRQPSAQLGASRQRDAQADAPVHSPRVTRVASRERTLAVLACDVPAGWRHYFRDSGIVVRSPDGAAAMIDAQSGTLQSNSGDPFVRNTDKFRATYSAFAGRDAEAGYYGDIGGASRFYYTAKASRSEREEGLEGQEKRPLAMSAVAQSALARGETRNVKGDIGLNDVRHVRNNHPTVKPVSLMRWLVRLVTPPNGLVLDPFCGSGTTGIACHLEDRKFIGIECSPEYAEIAHARIAHASRQPSLFAEVAS